MAEVTDVDIAAGVPTSGTGTVPTLSKTNTLLGAVTETAPGSDTASSGLNGRLQRIAQRVTSLISSTLATSVADGSSVTLGAKADAKSTATDTTAITIMSVLKQISASVQSTVTALAGTLTVATHAVTQSGTWTVQPGNTANTTAWKVDGSAVTQPVSGSVTATLAAGTAGIGKLTANSGVDIGDVDVTTVGTVTPGTAATSLGKAIDSAAGSTDTGVATLAVRKDTLATLTPADGDYVPLRVSSTGALHVTGSAGATEYTEDVAAAIDPVGGVIIGVRQDTLATNTVTADGDNIAIRASNKGQLHVLAAIDTSQLSALGQTTMSASAPVVIASDQTKVPVVGNTAHDAADSDNPIKVGGQARTTNPTAVADADRANLITDKLGKLISVSAIRDLKGITQTPLSNSTSETIIITAVASTFMDLYGLILANTGATATTVTIKDASSGTTRAKIYVPVGDTRGFMLDPGAAIPQAAVNNNWTATCSAATTAMEVTAMWVKNT